MPLTTVEYWGREPITREPGWESNKVRGMIELIDIGGLRTQRGY